MVEKLPPEASDSENWKTILTGAEDFLRVNSESEMPSISPSDNSLQQNAPNKLDSNDSSSKLQDENSETEGVESSSRDEGNVLQESNNSYLSNNEASMSLQNSLREPSRSMREGETQVIEQFEPGVYVTLIVKPNGIRTFKRVRFRYCRYLLFVQQFSISFSTCIVVMFELLYNH